MEKQKQKPKRRFSGVDDLPKGKASDKICSGCLVLEGGAFRGVYTSGVLDAIMEADLNFECTVGVSAGALNAVNYVSGQIGRNGRVNLTYRHDKRYVSHLSTLKANRGIIGFDFVFDTVTKYLPFDKERFDSRAMRLIAVCSNLETGKPVYFEKGVCPDIYKAVSASASMPYVSKPVFVDGTPCLDGGCTDKIPYSWGLEHGYDKVVVVKTRQDEYRKKIKPHRDTTLAKLFYKKYPAFVEALAASNADYNAQCDEIEELKNQGKIFVVSPSSTLTVGRLEKDMEKLGDFYYLGYNDGVAAVPAIKKYLGTE